MSCPASSETKHRYLLAIFFLSLAVLAGLAFVGYQLVNQQRYVQRGVSHQALPPLSLPCEGLYGVNVSLEQYRSNEELRRALKMVRDGGFSWVRQHFPWAEIEPQPGEYDWERWDRIVAEIKRQGLEIIAVLDTSPAWARRPVDHDNYFAPPQFVTTFGLFARAFAQRYGDQITCYQVWDQPNISPYWGARSIDPAAYVRLLTVAASELRRSDDDAIVLCAGLAPNTEAGGRNMSDVLFLRGIYQAGGKGYFDVLAAKPYGFWSGPEDRRVDPQVLNFSRLILLREEMVRYGDKNTPIWAVEFGWNSLPKGWQGQPSPWGTDDIDKQANRITRALVRARQEWAWLGVMCWAHLQPAVPADDPLWGFALLSSDFEPTPFYQILQKAISTPVPEAKVDYTVYYLSLALVLGMALIVLVLLVRLCPLLPWDVWSARLSAAYLGAPEWLQWGLLGLVLLMYYSLPWPVLALAMLLLAAVLIALRLDIGLAYLVFSIPFFLYPKVIFGKAFSLVETLTLVCFTAWLWQRVHAVGLRSTLGQIKALPHSMTPLDWTVVVFVSIAALSLFVSANRSVSFREFRVIIIEPALLYLLLRQNGLEEKALRRLADALLLAGLAVSVFGLYQYFVSGDVIIAEGVRRVRGVYASPNNLSLLLGRIIPLALSGFVVGGSRRRISYGLALLPLVLCLFLTYSRGGWLLSLPAALLTVGLLRGRRATLFALVAIVVGCLVLVPLIGTQRLATLANFEQGTTFRRLKLWQATLAMIRDHPITGVGLDNFLYQYPHYMLREAWQEPDLSHPHNIILDYWTRLGIGGVVILFLLEAAFFKLALRTYWRLPDGDDRAIVLGLIAGMVSTLVHGLIDNSYFLVDLAFIFFLSFGLVQALSFKLDLERA